MEEAGHLKDVLMKKRSFAANLKEEIDPAIREYFDNAIAQLSVGNPNLNLYHMALDCSIRVGVFALSTPPLASGSLSFFAKGLEG